MANLNLLKFNEELKLKVRGITSTWHARANYKNLVTFFFTLILREPERFRNEFRKWIEERNKQAA